MENIASVKGNGSARCCTALVGRNANWWEPICQACSAELTVVEASTKTLI